MNLEPRPTAPIVKPSPRLTFKALTQLLEAETERSLHWREQADRYRRLFDDMENVTSGARVVIESTDDGWEMTVEHLYDNGQVMRRKSYDHDTLAKLFAWAVAYENKVKP